MFVIIAIRFECYATDVARVGAFIGVRAYVLLQHRRFCAIQITIRTHIASRVGACCVSIAIVATVLLILLILINMRQSLRY